MSRFRSAFIAAAAATSLASCSRGPSGTVVLGAAGPIGSANGDANMQGFELAIDELNARTGSSLKFDKVILNDSASGGVAARVAQQFVDNPRIIAVVGHVNSGTMM